MTAETLRRRRQVELWYLGGKIRKGLGNYRAALLGYRDAYAYWASSLGNEEEGRAVWPILEGALPGGGDYSGPFTISDDHGCGHGPATHGAAASDNGGCLSLATRLSEPATRDNVYRNCKMAVARSSAFFAYIESADAYGTLAELGWATAQGIPVYLAFAPEVDTDTRREWWFAAAAATAVIDLPDQSPKTAFARACEMQAERRRMQRRRRAA